MKTKTISLSKGAAKITVVGDNESNVFLDIYQNEQVVKGIVIPSQHVRMQGKNEVQKLRKWIGKTIARANRGDTKAE